MARKSSLDEVQEFAQQALSLTPVIILGSGASAAYGIPGMPHLASHLLGLTPNSAWSNPEVAEWSAFCSHLRSGLDLEASLGAVRFTERQTGHVANETRSLLLPSDERVFASLLANRRSIALTRLYRHLFTSTHKSIDVITPNYDRIAEYAADAGEFSHFTGFSYGYLQTRAKDPKARVHVGTEPARTVCVWKVHGSLDWFRDQDQQILGARTCRDTPAGYSPLMITPGIGKYRLSHSEPFRTILGCADAALEKARSYLCVGYGFNDEHVQTKLVERCDSDSVPIVVITKELSPAAKAFFNGGRCRKYLAIEESASGVRAYLNSEPAGIDLACNAIWQLGEFLDLTLGAEA